MNRYVSKSTVVCMALALNHFGCEQETTHENQTLNESIEASGGSVSSGGNRTLPGTVTTELVNAPGTQVSHEFSQNQNVTGGASSGSGGTSFRDEGNTRATAPQSSGSSVGGGTSNTLTTTGTTAVVSTDAKCRPAPTCPEGWIVYDDAMCPLAKVITCVKNGDGLCYEPCKTDSDCKSAVFPKCGSITFFHHSDAGGPVSVCVSIETVPACTS
jgi:hypothetical protein